MKEVIVALVWNLASKEKGLDADKEGLSISPLSWIPVFFYLCDQLSVFHQPLPPSSHRS